ncbi:hypothetical protein K4K57_008838 [Colletotrichum sp. SAR 10_99]|nr:hypothetical protein K4K55_001836 [Colletotrichum sp. SAR 10_96]KAI8254146.1 hypothetical protein K4K56_008470 [Colletotrichum sp. SAR 10_98]KAJ5009408.1 hypothetical protein K4K57_008838 [Colletotrichum sp. SAR 10_99]
MGADGRRFRINITGVEQGAVRSARRQAETIDFDITSVILNPLYANPSSSGVLEMILRKDERIARLSFMGRKDIIKFQQAVTGFKAFDNYCQYNTMPARPDFQRVKQRFNYDLAIEQQLRQ